MISLYQNNPEISLSARRIEIIEKYNKIIEYGRLNPVWFIENIMKIKLMDYQKYVIMRTWTAKEAVWLMGRGSGKSFIGSLYLTAKALLFPSYRIYIMTGTAEMSKETFSNIERMARKNITTIVGGGSDMLMAETVKTNNGDGFKGGMRCDFYNGSFIQSLIGDEKGIVGKRCEICYYDEAGKISSNFFALTEPFSVVDSNFKTGGDIKDLTVLPLNIPTQHLYTSSAEDVTTHLYKKYKECARAMMMGRNDIFCVDFNCEIPLHPTIDGKEQKPLLSQSTVDAAMRDNEYKALREYYNIFDTNGGMDNFVGRDTITENERVYLPVFSHKKKDDEEGIEKKYFIAFDPAQTNDNSIIMVMECRRTAEEGWVGRIINIMNMLEVLPDGTKRLYASPEQFNKLKKIIVDYSDGSLEYNNLEIYIDPGAGGMGRSYANLLMPDWEGYDGVMRKGLIDMDDDYEKDQKVKYPGAVDGVLHLWSSQKYRNEFFTRAADVIRQNKITFLPPLPSSKTFYIDDKQVRLTDEEIRVLVEGEMLKEEAVSIKKIKKENGGITYSLPSDKIRKMHDDRAFLLAVCGFYLSKLREKDNLGTQQSHQMDFSVLYRNRNGYHSGPQKNTPFNGKNPFSGKKSRF